ncbi:MAG: hypothetical protein Q9N34_00265 [Aquificota bacterium]|nr:hypothetical protein [Aquificota bacterium]
MSIIILPMTVQSSSRRSRLLILTACGGGEEKTAPGERVFEVRTIEAKATDYPLTYTTNGYLEAVYRVEVRPEVSGRVVEVLAEEETG